MSTLKQTNQCEVNARYWIHITTTLLSCVGVPRPSGHNHLDVAVQPLQITISGLLANLVTSSACVDMVTLCTSLSILCNIQSVVFACVRAFPPLGRKLQLLGASPPYQNGCGNQPVPECFPVPYFSPETNSRARGSRESSALFTASVWSSCLAVVVALPIKGRRTSHSLPVRLGGYVREMGVIWIQSLLCSTPASGPNPSFFSFGSKPGRPQLSPFQPLPSSNHATTMRFPTIDLLLFVITFWFKCLKWKHKTWIAKLARYNIKVHTAVLATVPQDVTFQVNR